MSLEQVWNFFYFEMDRRKLLEEKLRQLEQQEEISESESEQSQDEGEQVQQPAKAIQSKVSQRLNQIIEFGRRTPNPSQQVNPALAKITPSQKEVVLPTQGLSDSQQQLKEYIDIL